MEFASTLASASPALMLAIFIVAMATRRLILPRELDAANKRIEELERERDEYKQMAFRALDVGERAITTVEREGRR